MPLESKLKKLVLFVIGLFSSFRVFNVIFPTLDYSSFKLLHLVPLLSLFYILFFCIFFCRFPKSFVYFYKLYGVSFSSVNSFLLSSNGFTNFPVTFHLFFVFCHFFPVSIKTFAMILFLPLLLLFILLLSSFSVKVFSTIYLLF